MLLAGCSDCGAAKSIVGRTVVSLDQPGGAAKALVTINDTGGATVSTSYRVYLQDSANARPVTLVLVMDKGSQPKVEWTSPRQLRIEAPCAQIFQFTNFATLFGPRYGADPHDFQTVEIDLSNPGLVCAEDAQSP